MLEEEAQKKREHVHSSVVKLTAIEAYRTSHLANEALNETKIRFYWTYTDLYLPEIKQRTETKTQQAMAALLCRRQRKGTINVSLNRGIKH